MAATCRRMACIVRLGPRSNMTQFWNRKDLPYNGFSADGELWVNWLSQPLGPPQSLFDASVVYAAVITFSIVADLRSPSKCLDT